MVLTYRTTENKFGRRPDPSRDETCLYLRPMVWPSRTGNCTEDKIPNPIGMEQTDLWHQSMLKNAAFILPREKYARGICFNIVEDNRFFYDNLTTLDACIVRKKERSEIEIKELFEENSITAVVKENSSKSFTIKVVVGTVMGYIGFSIVFLILVWSLIYPGKYW